jgi:hypothetical protein
VSRPGDLSRREVLKITAGAVVASQVAAMTPAFADVPTLRFFTAQEFALVDELTDIVIPTDEHSPGARAAKVAAFLDGRLAEVLDEDVRTRWRDGLKQVDALAQSLHGQPFMNLDAPARVDVVTRMAANEAKPSTPEERFFGELKSRTVHAYYSSEIGIHTEMEYKGNVMLQDFVGTDVSHT